MQKNQHAFGQLMEIYDHHGWNVVHPEFNYFDNVTTPIQQYACLNMATDVSIVTSIACI